MRFWWVNQNQTFVHEFEGGYIWSPKRKANNKRNPFYEFMREVAPGDLIFSFKDTRIPVLGIAQSHCYEAPKPNEFGAAGENWSNIGWKVEVRYFQLRNQIRPADQIDVLGPLLPKLYSPLQATGRGNQSVYLTAVPPQLALALVGLIGDEAKQLAAPAQAVAEPAEDEVLPVDHSMPSVLQWEDRIAKQIRSEEQIPETEREALITARRGQGLFKRNVRQYETRCRITGVVTGLST